MGKIDERLNRHYDDVEAVDILHQVAYLYTSTKVPRNYGTGDDYTSLEVHTLKYIADHPGITVTELARDHGKTKGAISQILKKIESKGLVYRKTDPTNDNRQLLYITEKGKSLDEIHRKFDAVMFGKSMNRVRAIYSEEEVDIAFRVLESWLEIRLDIQQERIQEKKKKAKEERLERNKANRVKE